MATAAPVADVFVDNPYDGHPSLSPLEAEVLWEYAKLAQHVKQVKPTNSAIPLADPYACS